MRLEITCKNCGQRASVLMPDSLGEDDAQRIANSYVCQQCAGRVQAEQARRQEETSCRTCGSKGWRTMDELRRLVDEQTDECRRVMDRADATLRKLKAKEATKPAPPATQPPVAQPTPKPPITLPEWAKSISVDNSVKPIKGTNEKPSNKRIYV